MTLEIVIIILVVVIAAYLTVMFLQRSSVKKVAQIKDKKEQLQSLKVQDELIEGRKMSLTGDSLKQYQKLENTYNDVKNNKFLKIDQQSELVIFEARGLSIWKTRRELQRLVAMTDDTEAKIKTVRQGLQELHRIDEEHREAVTALKQTTTSLRQRLDDATTNFGPAKSTLTTFLAQLQSDYDDFTQLTDRGDHAAASAIHEQLGMETAKMTTLLDEIPGKVTHVNTTYVEQMNELSQGYDDLVGRGYVFPNDHVADELQAIDSQRHTVLGLLGELRVKDANEQMGHIESRIDALYQMIETEVAARATVDKQQAHLAATIDRLRQQNSVLAVELDRLSQSFRMNHHELESQRQLLEQITAIDQQHQTLNAQLFERTLAYSEAATTLAHLISQFDGIQTEQKQIWDKVSGLENAQRSAAKMGAKYQQDIEAIKNHVERMNLPGLPAEYLEYFFAVSGELERLGTALAATHVDMDDVQRQLNIVGADVDTLNEKTTVLVDDANIAEQLIQYSNRYRGQSQAIAQALSQSQRLYEEAYNYHEVRRVMGRALNQVEPNSTQKITDMYMRHKQPLM